MVEGTFRSENQFDGVRHQPLSVSVRRNAVELVYDNDGGAGQTLDKQARVVWRPYRISDVQPIHSRRTDEPEFAWGENYLLETLRQMEP